MLKEKDKVQSSTRADFEIWLKDIIKASARYERLMALKDFKDILEDMKKLIEVHENQISGLVAELEGISYFRKMRILAVIEVHQVRAKQLKEAVAYPAKLIDAAVKAREDLKNLIQENENAARNN